MDCGGDTAYVFIAMIVLSDENGIIKHTAESLARAICKDVESVKKALYNLERQDLKSNLKAHEGRRIVPLYEIFDDETRGWLVVNKGHYRDKVDPQERRDYMREYMRKYRKGDAVNSGKQVVNTGKPDLAHTDTDTDTTTTLPPQGGEFARFWTAWPSSTRKESKGKCEELWKRLKCDAKAAEIIAHVEDLKASEGWRKQGGEFIPAPLVYLRNRRWEGAEPPKAAEKRLAI